MMTCKHKELQFKLCLKSWTGRYGRILGHGTYWKVKNCQDGWQVILSWSYDDDTRIECHARDGDGAQLLAQTVAFAKKAMGGQGGGSFVINEYGQVIVPNSKGNGQYLMVGEIDGCFWLNNPLSNSPIDRWFQLWDTGNLQSGDVWTKPYIGV